VTDFMQATCYTHCI